MRLTFTKVRLLMRRRRRERDERERERNQLHGVKIEKGERKAGEGEEQTTQGESDSTNRKTTQGQQFYCRSAIFDGYIVPMRKSGKIYQRIG